MDDDVDSEDYDDESNDDDDSSLLIHVPLLQSTAEAPSKILDQPPAGFEWNDNAILECLELAVQRHDQDNNSNSNDQNPINFEWYPPPTQNPSQISFVSSWQPKSLPLPSWAKNPFAELLVEKQNESIPK